MSTPEGVDPEYDAARVRLGRAARRLSHAVIGREMFRTWEQMLDLIQKGMDVHDLVSAEMGLDDFGTGVDRFGQGLESKVVLYPNGKPR